MLQAVPQRQHQYSIEQHLDGAFADFNGSYFTPEHFSPLQYWAETPRLDMKEALTHLLYIYTMFVLMKDPQQPRKNRCSGGLLTGVTNQLNGSDSEQADRVMETSPPAGEAVAFFLYKLSNLFRSCLCTQHFGEYVVLRLI